MVPTQSMKPMRAMRIASSGMRFGDRSATNWPRALVNAIVSFLLWQPVVSMCRPRAGRIARQRHCHRTAFTAARCHGIDAGQSLGSAWGEFPAADGSAQGASGRIDWRTKNGASGMSGSSDAQALLDRIEHAAQSQETPCGDGTMVWRIWGSGPVVLLLHGGAGSWRHWVRNLDHLSLTHTVVAPDLPGLGDSARAPDPIDAISIGAIVTAGLEQVVG